MTCVRKSGTGGSLEELSYNAICPGCDKRHADERDEIDGFIDVVMCKSCGTFRNSPRFTGFGKISKAAFLAETTAETDEEQARRVGRGWEEKPALKQKHLDRRRRRQRRQKDMQQLTQAKNETSRKSMSARQTC